MIWRKKNYVDVNEFLVFPHCTVIFWKRYREIILPKIVGAVYVFVYWFHEILLSPKFCFVLELCSCQNFYSSWDIVLYEQIFVILTEIFVIARYAVYVKSLLLLRIWPYYQIRDKKILLHYAITSHHHQFSSRSQQ